MLQLGTPYTGEEATLGLSFYLFLFRLIRVILCEPAGRVIAFNN